MRYSVNIKIGKLFDLNQGAHGHTDVIWPNHNSQKSLPEKIQMQKTNREQPTCRPRKRREPMLFDFDFFHIILSLNCYLNHPRLIYNQ